MMKWDFDLRISTLGNNFNIKNIARLIISEVNEAVEERFAQLNTNDQTIGDSLQWMEDKVQDVLNSKSCLIVLDNLWGTHGRELRYLNEMLRDKQNR